MEDFVDVSKLTFEMTKKLRVFLKLLIDQGGSDLHIKSSSLVRGRINGKIVPFSKEPLSYDDGLLLAKELLRGRFGELVRDKSADFTYKYDEHYRFRVNIFFQIEGVSAVFRTIPNKMPTFEALGLPSIIEDFCQVKRGLILVTGPTGSGKTTTLAAMINKMNHTRAHHIITVEDPVEYQYIDNTCIINQRAVGQDATNFASALRAALREDPDVILVGEMRDLETIETALHAAETGHLVLSTLHTVDAKETINRIIGMFPGEDHNRISMQLAAVLQGIVSQRLVRTLDGKRAASMEIMVKTKRIEGMILNGQDSLITDAIAEGSDTYGSQTFDQSLLWLYSDGKISYTEALENSTSPNDLKLKLDDFNEKKIKAEKIARGEIVEGDDSYISKEEDLPALKLT